MKKVLQLPNASSLLGAASALACLALALPAQAHDLGAQAGLASGVVHPLLGVDHLFLLIAVGAVAAAVSPLLLAWALAGGLLGAALGVSGLQVPALELMAALAISAVGLLVLNARGAAGRALIPAGSLVAAAVAVHAMLHGQAAPSEASAGLWWFGAAASSTLVCGGSFLLLRRVAAGWIQRLGLLLVVVGGVAALSL